MNSSSSRKKLTTQTRLIKNDNTAQVYADVNVTA